MTDSGPAIVWFRNDLRLADNPALTAALGHAGPVKAVFVHEEDSPLRPTGAASRWWLHRSLNALAADLAGLGVPLEVHQGRSADLLPHLASNAAAVYWNRRYGPAERTLDAGIKAALASAGVEAKSFSASLLVEPFDIATGSGRPYQVFTPFWRALRQREIALPLPRPVSRRAPLPTSPLETHYVEPAWAGKLAPHWTIGEAAASTVLATFLDTRIATYAQGRDHPDLEATSRLSPHLHFGEIGPRQVWHAIQFHAGQQEAGGAADKFLSELAWREFAYHLLFHHANLAEVPVQPRFSGMPWRVDPGHVEAWQQGRTGFPIIDAGMRQLWETGWMHNRVRMLVASLLAKNLLIDWRTGEQWFWDTLVDADPANNPASWQWVAGCGADAAPYFRIFNPVVQGERFDAKGAYVRRWVPELARLPDAFVHHPFDAPAGLLAAAGVALGGTYPRPIVDLGDSRRRALAVLAGLPD